MSKKRMPFIVTIILLLAIYLGGVIYFSGHTYPRTVYGQIPAGNLDKESLKSALDNADNVSFTIKEGDKTSVIEGKSIDYDATFDLNSITFENKIWSWPVEIFKPHELPKFSYSATYNKDKLMAEVEKLPLITEVVRKPSTDAMIIEGNGQFVIQDEFYGNEVDMDKLKNFIDKSVTENKRDIDIEAEKPYKEPQVLKNNEELNSKLSKDNAWVGTDISLSVDGNIIPLVDWRNKYGLETNENENFEEYNKEIYTKIADEMAEKYNTVHSTRVFNNSLGDKIKLDPGTFGWYLNYDELLKRLNDGVARGTVKTIDVPFFGVANGEPPNDIGNSYVEIDLSTQHLWIYKDGERVIDTPIVSGNINIAGRETPTGVYYILRKSSPSILEGPSYIQPVNFWMPFTEEGHGLHDADWISEDSFGGDTFETLGSHGCINLPPSLTETIYNTVYPSMPVVIYKSFEAPVIEEGISEEKPGISETAKPVNEETGSTENNSNESNDNNDSTEIEE